MSKFLSRKFLTTIIAQIVGILIAIYPTYTDQIQGWQTITLMCVGVLQAVLAQLGYNYAEGKIDAANAANSNSTTTPIV